MTQVPLSTREAAKFLGVSERYLRDLVAAHRVPFYRLPAGRAGDKNRTVIRFQADELVEWFKASRVAPKGLPR